MLFVTVVPSAGTTLRNALTEASDLAKQLTLGIHLEFDGTGFDITPTSVPQTIFDSLPADTKARPPKQTR